MKLSFSTSWLDGDISRLEAIIPYIDALEIGTKGDEEFFISIEKIIQKSGTPVTSIHASSGPHKSGKEPYYTPHFASFDNGLRQYDIEQAAFSAEWAQKLGTRAIVLHIGSIEDQALKHNVLMYKERVLHEEWNEELEEMKGDIARKRKIMSRDFLENAIIGLEELCKNFPDIIFCIETRVHFYEIPLPEEALYIFKRLPLPNLGYWHDIGHTYILAQLGFIPMNVWQSQLDDKCMGTHIHDVDHDLTDHLPPGYGLLNFHHILEQFDMLNLHTLEINPRHTLDSVIKGIQHLRKIKGST